MERAQLLCIVILNILPRIEVSTSRNETKNVRALITINLKTKLKLRLKRE